MIRKSQNGNKYKMINLEEIEIGKTYSFSYNDQEQPLFEKFYKMKLNNLRDWSNSQKERLTLKYADVDMYLELSPKGRFHWHGKILIRDPVKFIIHDLAKLRHYGTYEIDTITDTDKWDNYITKQQKYMEKYANNNNMIYNITSLQ